MKRLPHLLPHHSEIPSWNRSRKKGNVFSFNGFLSSYGYHQLWVEYVPLKKDSLEVLTSSTKEHELIWQ